MNIQVVQGDITKCEVDAIVNAANAQLAGGGGVDGAIHRAAGAKQLQQACRALGGANTGEVKPTPGFNLPAKYIFHAVGPIYDASKDAEMERLLASCYRNAMRLAKEHGCRSIAFPSISTGVYGYPKEKAMPISIRAIREAAEHGNAVEEVYLVAFSEDDRELWESFL